MAVCTDAGLAVVDGAGKKLLDCTGSGSERPDSECELAWSPGDDRIAVLQRALSRTLKDHVSDRLRVWEIRSSCQLAIGLDPSPFPIRSFDWQPGGDRIELTTWMRGHHTWTLDNTAPVEIDRNEKMRGWGISGVYLESDPSKGTLFLRSPGKAGREVMDVPSGIARNIALRIDWSPDGRFVCVEYGPYGIVVVDATNARVVWATAEEGAVVVRAAWSPDGSALATVALDGGVKIRARDTGHVVADHETHSAAARWVIWQSDTSILVGGKQRTVRIEHPSRAEIVRRLQGYLDWEHRIGVLSPIVRASD